MSGPTPTGVAGVAGHPAGTLGLWPQVRAGRLFLALMVALVALAWLGLVVWKWSPYGGYLNHGAHHGTQFSGAHLRLLGFFVAAWTLMTVAMMLPTSLPLVAFFQSLVRERSERARLVALLVTGYLGVWIAFALVAHSGEQAIQAAVDRNGWMGANAWVIGASTFVVAGVYQFTGLKYRCLDKCRSPVGFVLAHWRGRREGFEALRLGAHHGIFCLGCCWSLMLLMFAVGAGNLGWMLALAAVMATEKNVSWGRRLSAPVGLVLVVSGIALAIAGFAGAETQQFGNVRAIVGPGPVTTSLRHGAYRLEFGIQPNRASVPNTVALRIGRAGRPVVGADITATLTMLDMSMGSQTYHLGESAAGLYRFSTPALVMSGRWGISFQVRPPRRSRFDVAVLDHASG